MGERATNTKWVREVPVTAVEGILERRDLCVVDLRSPTEFAEDHLPGAHNVPLFDDAERAIIGTLYKRSSPEAAFQAGRELVTKSIHSLVARIAECAGLVVPSEDLVAAVRNVTMSGYERANNELETQAAASPPPGALVLHCWRGGLRSRSVVSFLRELGWRDVYGVESGYRGYRRAVMEALGAFEPPPTFVLRGWTGVGKTLVLRELERIRPGWTLDLEGCAGHRSSVLGMVGLEPVSQKAFESRIAARLRAGFPGPFVVEGESRKVGNAIQPPRIWDALQNGANLLLVAPIERRIDVLLDDYLALPENRAGLREQLPFIEQRLGPNKWKDELVKLLDAHEDRELCRVLLEHYYDPLYRHSEKGRTYAGEFDTSDPAASAEAIARFIESSK